MSSSSTEIWATRLQRELAAITEQEEGKASGNAKANDVGVLPEFLKYKEHNLDIDEGKCSVSFILTVMENKTSSSETETTTSDNVKETGEDSEDKKEETEEKSSDESTVTPVNVTITLDASVNYKDSNPDTSISYPFRKPKALISEGSEHLPSGSNIQNGDEIDIDCDWTPSLHLNDAVLNIALKVREGIKRDEPCFKVEPFANLLTNSVNESTQKVADFFSNLRTKASEVAEELDAAMVSEKPKKLAFRRIKAEVKPPPKEVTASNVEVGDVIDLSQTPWSSAVGMYPIKALRRPEFMVATLATLDDETTKVAGSGINSARSMFSSFTQSAKNLVEEAFLMLTEELILEIKCNKFSVANATVSFVIPISNLSKLKFRRQESISLFFKQDPDSPVIYMCVSSADAVKQIQTILKRHGVSGKHTNATMQRTIQSASELFNETQLKEKALEDNPRREDVTKIMDLYRQAAEKFELAGDARHEQVMTQMKAFLAKPIVATILDTNSEKKSAVPEGEILETLPSDDDDDTKQVKSSSADIKDETEPKKEEMKADAQEDDGEDFQKAMEAAEEMLKGAHDDLKDLGIEDNDDFDVTAEMNKIKDDGKSADESGMDVVSEFEDMLKDADKELAELMGS